MYRWGSFLTPTYRAAAGSTLSYDANGNLGGDGVWTYAYNLDNQLTSANKTGSANSLAYDGAGRLSQTTLAGIVTNLSYDDSNLVAEYDNAGTLLRRYVHGPGVDEPLVWYEGAVTTAKTWLYSDHQGSIVATANSAGTSTATLSYGPYGEPNATTGVRFRYTGQQLIGPLNLYYYKARMYSPAIGRFLQTDPIGYQDGLNWYAYVGNNPFNRRDPSGLVKIPGISSAVKALGNFVTEKHHTVPVEILKSLPPEVANNPLVRGAIGAPNKWAIPKDIHREIHQGAGGGSYNEAWKAGIAKITENRPVTADDVVDLRTQLTKQFGIDQYRPTGGSGTLNELGSVLATGAIFGLEVLDKASQILDPIGSYLLGSEVGAGSDVVPRSLAGNAGASSSSK